MTAAAATLAPARASVEYVALDLPAPISTNDLWTIRKSRFGKHHLSRTHEYEAWLKSAGWSLVAQKPGRVAGAYGLRLTVGRDSKIDLGNAEKAVSDLLEKYGVIDNDRFASEIHLGWGDGEGMHALIVKAKDGAVSAEATIDEARNV